MNRDEIIKEFCDNAANASYYHASEQSEERLKARPHVRRYQEIYDSADRELRRELEAAWRAGGYLATLERKAAA